MPEWIWLVVAFWGSVATAVLLYLIAKRGGKIGFGKNVMTVNGEVMDGKYKHAIRYVESRVGEVHHILFGRYLRLIKDNGAEPNRLTEYEDARFMKMLLQYLVSGGNGSRSIQKILESEVVYGDWQRYKHDLKGYAKREIWPQVLRVARDRINSEYDSVVLVNDGTYRPRWAATADVVDAYSEDSIEDSVCTVFDSILLYASVCKNGGCPDVD